jgi:hypothetical protein
MTRLARAQVAFAVMGLLSANGAIARADEKWTCMAAADRAQDLRSAHELRHAREALLECTQATCPTVIRKDCSLWLSEVDEALPTVMIRAKTASGDDEFDVRVFVDGELLTERIEGRSLPVEPGRHVFRYEMAGAPPIEERVFIMEGQKDRPMSIVFGGQIALAPPPPSPSQSRAKELTPLTEAPAQAASSRHPTRVLSYVIGGVGLVAAGSFAYFGIEGRSQASTLAQGCGATKSCTDAQVDPVHSELVAADVSLGIAIVSLGAATWLFFSHPSSAATKKTTGSSVQLTGGVSARGGMVAAGWSF